MVKNVARLGLASLSIAAFAQTAVAQEEDEFGEPVAEEPVEETASNDSAPASSSDASGFTMGISTAFPTGGDAGAANVLYGLDANTWLNLHVGVSFGPGAPVVDAMGGITPGDDVFGIDLGVGYRMYKDSKGKIRPYLEPAAGVSITDFSAAGDTMSITAGALMGVDYALMEQFTLGTGVGAGLSYVNLDALSFGLLTANINATFWW